MKKIICFFLLFICIFFNNVNAAPNIVSTGDLGNNVITGAGLYEVFLDPPHIPSNSAPSNIEVKYGLWNSPDVDVSVFFNDTFLGNFIADNGYISPGPEFITFDTTGLLFDGLNKISFNGFGVEGDYVIGQVDLIYNPIPEPETYAMLLAGLGLLGYRLRLREKETIA